MSASLTGFVDRLADYIPSDRVEQSDDKVYVYAPEGGFGIQEEVYDGHDVRLIESIGMDSLSENHTLYREDAHHVLIFKEV
ncbi:hypothetical protein [Haloferax larsenii]|uniref:Uncharacterized protein n=1 Tax=Haloferax larsenii TaxID=302484 RepID=A0A1H7N6Y0_HALLR|nr:hypothetical protein [Haloferax larsenii]SEL19263.1 hypothetical protein SAMN04488691_103210 [Haloferax larsenii]